MDTYTLARTVFSLIFMSISCDFGSKRKHKNHSNSHFVCKKSTFFGMDERILFRVTVYASIYIEKAFFATSAKSIMALFSLRNSRSHFGYHFVAQRAHFYVFYVPNLV